ncbi:TPA: hypothetical protein ACSP1Y_002990 [Aeromonas hydrophila]|uniref:hypothetical protein n=1 Tax=Aeromonas allosaccharophila TaxID=656 RepID=UPI0039884333
MNIVSKQFTKEQYKALYEAQQLGVRFDCYLLPPGVRIDGLTVIDERAHQPVPNFSVPTLEIKVPKNTGYECDECLQKIMLKSNNRIRDIINNHNNK